MHIFMNLERAGCIRRGTFCDTPLLNSLINVKLYHQRHVWLEQRSTRMMSLRNYFSLTPLAGFHTEEGRDIFPSRSLPFPLPPAEILPSLAEVLPLLSSAVAKVCPSAVDIDIDMIQHYTT